MPPLRVAFSPLTSSDRTAPALPRFCFAYMFCAWRPAGIAVAQRDDLRNAASLFASGGGDNSELAGTASETWLGDTSQWLAGCDRGIQLHSTEATPSRRSSIEVQLQEGVFPQHLALSRTPAR